MKYLESTGIGDVVYFGPENEFFVFDELRVRDDINCQYYEVDTEEGVWNTHAKIQDGYNTGHRPGTKGGYFPVPPVDSMMDIRAEMVKVLKQVGLETNVFHHEEIGRAHV